MRSSLFDLHLRTQRAKQSCIPSAPVLVQSVQLCPVAEKIPEAEGGNTRSALCSSRAGTNVAFRQAEAAHEEASCPQVLMLQLSRAGRGCRSSSGLQWPAALCAAAPSLLEVHLQRSFQQNLKKKIKIPVQCLKSQPNGWHWHQALLVFLFGVSRQHVCL